MTTYVALLRGINVGGNRKLPMADLRECATGCGFDDVATYIQSGNLLFTTARTDLDGIAADLEAAIEAKVGFRPPVILRTAAELAAIVASPPFPAEHLHVVFLADPPTAPLPDTSAYAPEAAMAIGREVYLYLPGGMGRSKLAADSARWKPTVVGTARNWRTVTTLASMAAELDRA